MVLRLLWPIAAVAVIPLAVVAIISCDDYEAPPKATIVGLNSRSLDDPRAPLVIDFGVPVEEDSVRIRVVKDEKFGEGELGDDDDDPKTTTTVYLSHEPGEVDRNVRTTFDETRRFVTLTLTASLPVSQPLLLLVESGVRSKSGRETTYRQEVEFSYPIKCTDAGSANFRDGTYFLAFDVDKPLGARIQLFGKLAADKSTGMLVGQFTKADRDLQQVCPMPCEPNEACRLLPAPECVTRSTPVATLDEYPDYLPNTDPSNRGGFTVTVHGCAVDDGTDSNVVTAPVTLSTSGIVIAGLTMNAKFVPEGDAGARGSGTLAADGVTTGAGKPEPGEGALIALRVPDDRVPADVPSPPPPSSGSGDGGADAMP